MKSSTKVQKEIFKSIPNYENYQVSNLGNVKSLKFGKERILKPSVDSGYLVLCFCKNGIQKKFKVHQLVAIVFKNHKPTGSTKGLVVDHINGIKTDNRAVNIQIISNRENCSKDTKGTSKYVGVSWYKSRKKFRVCININRKQEHLGYFENEIKASEAYRNKLKSI